MANPTFFLGRFYLEPVYGLYGIGGMMLCLMKARHKSITDGKSGIASERLSACF